MYKGQVLLNSFASGFCLCTSFVKFMERDYYIAMLTLFFSVMNIVYVVANKK